MKFEEAQKIIDKNFIGELNFKIVLLKSVEKQIPKLVDRYTHEVEIERVVGLVDTPICPNCKEVLKYWFQEFCDKCGQHISWENCDGYHFKDRKTIFDDLKKLEEL